MKKFTKQTQQLKQTPPKVTPLKTNLRYVVMGLSAFTLLACSGGSGNKTPSSSLPSTTSYPPSAERLLEEATNSNDLYVEADFSFDQLQATQLSILAMGSDGQPIPYTRLNIYLIDTSELERELTEWSDAHADKAHLIAGGLSNIEGEFIRIIEFPKSSQSNPTLLVEVNAIGFENKALVPVESKYTAITLGAI